MDGSAGYNICTAIAEMVDNSIEQTRGNTDERRIDITFSKQDGTISVLDNGNGMDAEALNNWARLGFTTSVIKDTLTTTTTASSSFDMHDDMKKRYISNTFSMCTCNILCFYIFVDGRGSKNAIFYLGNQVVAESKPKHCKMQYSITVSCFVNINVYIVYKEANRLDRRAPI